VHPALAIALKEAPAGVAVGGVHQQALALAQVAGDGVAGDGPAALRELHRHAFGTADDHRADRACIDRLAFGRGLAGELARDDGGEPLAEADVEDKPAVIPVDWQADWRTKMAGGDEALAKRSSLQPGQVIYVPSGHAISAHSVSFYAQDNEQAGLLARAQEIENLASK
jgi:hypothetical protein